MLLKVTCKVKVSTLIALIKSLSNVCWCKALTLVADETIFILTILCLTNKEKSCKMLFQKKGGGDYMKNGEFGFDI